MPFFPCYVSHATVTLTGPNGKPIGFSKQADTFAEHLAMASPERPYMVPAPCAATGRQARDQGMNSRSHRNLGCSGLRELEGLRV